MSTNFSKQYFQTLTSISTADPAVFTLVDHGLAPGDRIRLETTGTLPTPLKVKTDYWVVYNGISTSAFQVAATDGGTPIATTVGGSGSFIKMNRANLAPQYEDNR